MRERTKEIRKQHKRKAKLKKLKSLLAETKDLKKREEIIEKIRKYEYRYITD
jgi:hypothetical protein